MKDVAREAGVALGTVSKVFNNKPVGESYRKKVEEAAERLGYQVNIYARGLRSDKTYTVALILPNLYHPFFARLANEVCKALLEKGYRMIIATTDFDHQAEESCINMVKQNKVDGIIGLTYNPHLQVDDSIPFVSIDRIFGNNIPCVSSDNYMGGQLAAAKLTEFGCHRLLYFRTGSATFGECDKRGSGFESYCQTHKLHYDAIYLNDEDDLGDDPFYQYLDEHTRDGVCDFDGIFCSTDLLATHILKHLQSRGIQVPGQVQIIGYDGLCQFNLNDPFCSSIAQCLQ